MNTSVRSADRTLAIFETFAEVGHQLQLREIAELCEMPVSTCHALVQTLLKRGYLYTMGQRKEIYPSRRLATLGKTIDENDPYLSRISGVLEALRDTYGETVTVGKLQGDRILYLYALDGRGAVRYAAKAGDFRPLHSTAIGKAVLSSFEPAVLREWMRTLELTRVTAKTITSASRLTREINEGRQRGYFIARQEQADDLTAVAVPVRRQNETLGIGLAGPTSRMESKLDRYAARLLQVKAELEERLAA